MYDIHQIAELHIKYESERLNIDDISNEKDVNRFIRHFLVWNMISKSENKFGIIVENYVHLDNFDQLRIHSILRDCPDNVDFLSILYNFKKNTSSHSRDLVKLNGPHLNGMQCYMISKKFATHLCKKSFPIWTKLDRFVGINIVLNRNFHAYAIKMKLGLSKALDGSDYKKFNLKRILPSGNLFYYIMITLIIVFGILSITLICLRKKTILILKRQ